MPLTIQIRLNFSDEQLQAIARKLGRPEGRLATKSEATNEMLAVIESEMEDIVRKNLPPSSNAQATA